MKQAVITYHGKEIPVLDSVDVLVVGAGFPGICAAIASARYGASTMLVERGGLIGGQAAEIDTWGLDGFVNNRGKLLIGGIPWEILTKTVGQGQSDPMWSRISMNTLDEKGIAPALEEIGMDAYVPYCETGTFMNPFNDQYVNPNAYRYVSHLLLEEAGVRLLLEAPVIDTLVKDDNTVYGVVIQSVFQKYAILSKRIVDTSQNAVVCAHTGRSFPFPKAYMGTLTRVGGIDVFRLIDYIRHTDDHWFLRPMVGKKADPDEMEMLARDGNPLAIHGFMAALEKAVLKQPEYASLKRKNGDQLFFFYERDAMGSYWTFGDDFADVNTGDPFVYSKAILNARKQQWLMHRFFRDYIPGFENAHLMDVYANISKAYMQSMEPSSITEYNITPEEIKTGRTRREDVITIIRGHPNAGQNQAGWGIPLASLIPKGLNGLLVTGKPACRMIHYIASCAKVGEAAGTAAAVSAVSQVPLREMDTKIVHDIMFKRNQVTL